MRLDVYTKIKLQVQGHLEANSLKMSSVPKNSILAHSFFRIES